MSKERQKTETPSTLTSGADALTFFSVRALDLNVINLFVLTCTTAGQAPLIFMC